MNILAAGSSSSWLNSGSGIFSRGKVLVSHYNPTTKPINKLLIASIQEYIQVKTQVLPSLIHMERKDLTASAIAVVLNKPSTFELEIEHRGVKCNATLSAATNPKSNLHNASDPENISFHLIVYRWNVLSDSRI